MSYISEVLAKAIEQSPGQEEFHQALNEVLPTLQPVIDEWPDIREESVLERLVEPERQIIFRIPWVDDNGVIRVNRGFRVEFNSALGPYKGGLRFHPGVSLGTMKFLGFEQIFKNSLTGLPMGGGKGGSNFDPKGKSKREVMAFCQSFMNELYRHIGAGIDVPAGDIGVGPREVGYMFGQYKRLTGLYEGTFTGKGKSFGGSQVRQQATGYGLVYLMENILNAKGLSFENKTVVVSGSGNVAIYAAEKAIQNRARVVTMSDSDGFVYDEEGIDLNVVKKIKEENRGRISEYPDYKPDARFYKNRPVWSVPCDIALPCATQNELNEEDARTLVQNKCFAVGEGANMPSTPGAVAIFQANHVIFAPGKAANAGGVVVSALEMQQNSMRQTWSFEAVNGILQKTMKNIYDQIAEAAMQYNVPENYVVGANIAGFAKVVKAMIRQGAV